LPLFNHKTTIVYYLIKGIVLKRCTKCGKEKRPDEFHNSANSKDGKKSSCKQCRRQEAICYRNINIDKRRKQEKEWYANNTERAKKTRKDYYHANKDSILEKRTKYYQNNKEAVAKYYRERAKNDTEFKIRCNLRKRMSKIIRRMQKSGSAIRDLGCTVKQLMNHLESSFYNGMTWENYGKWHIDHIIPLSAFDLTDRDQFLQACNYKNLQPLWAKDNLSKSNKYIKTN